MAVIKREKPVVLTGAAASSFLSAKRMNEKKAKQYVSSIAKKAPKNKLK
ncbi:hypothetical protein [Vagococcus martis]|nr:hypothetical protein [Vagococcus martis]